MSFNCRNPRPLNGVASKSASAQKYLKGVQYVIGDGWAPVDAKTPKGEHNESFSLGLTWNSRCSR